MNGARRAAAGDLALLVAAIGWGATFPLIDAALRRASPLTLVAVRFLFAAALVAPFALSGRRRAATRRALGAGLALGALLALGYALQFWALPRIGPSRSAFLTVFYVLFTPLIEWAMTRTPPPRSTALGALLAFAGAVLMTGAGLRATPSAGDLATLACALVFAVQVVALGTYVRRHASLALLFLETAACGLIAAFCAPLLEAPRFAPDAVLVGALLFLSVVATIGLLGAQNYGQARTSASRAAVLFASEPVWAALFSHLAGERLGAREVAGAALVLAGILVASVPVRGRSRSA